MIKSLAKKDKYKTIRECIYVFFLDMPKDTIFYGRELENFVKSNMPSRREMYISTILRIARKYFRDDFVCICNPKSQFKRI